MVVKAIVIVGLAALVLVACRQPNNQKKWADIKTRIRDEFPSVRHMPVSELNSLLGQVGGVRPLLLDVREAKEYDVSHLPGAKRAAGLKEALRVLDGHDKDSLIVAYCSVGYRSSRLAEELESRGFTNVFNLEGSIFEWANRGLPVFRGEANATGVHPFDDEWGRLLDEELRQYEVKEK